MHSNWKRHDRQMAVRITAALLETGPRSWIELWGTVRRYDGGMYHRGRLTHGIETAKSLGFVRKRRGRYEATV